MHQHWVFRLPFAQHHRWHHTRLRPIITTNADAGTCRIMEPASWLSGKRFVYSHESLEMLTDDYSGGRGC